MIRILLFLVLCFFTVRANDGIVYRKWKVENEESWGSFYWMVSRSAGRFTEGKYAGQYVYAVILYSNSLILSGEEYVPAITYIKYPKVVMHTIDGIQMEEERYFIVDYERKVFALFASYSGNVDFTFSYEACYPYDVSTLGQQKIQQSDGGY